MVRTALLSFRRRVFFRTTQSTQSRIHKELPTTAAGTEEGMSWLRFALDPFHDAGGRLSGLPDSDSSQTIVQRVMRSINISAPSDAPGNWSCIIYNLPQMIDQSTLPIAATTGVYTAEANVGGDERTATAALTAFENAYNGTSTVVQSFINIHSFAGDAVEFWPNSTAYAAPLSVASLSASAGTSAASGAVMQRVIAAGFEVENTTSELNKQGLITCVRVPNRLSRSRYPLIYSNDPVHPLLVRADHAADSPAGGSLASTDTIMSSGPPPTLSAALAYAGASQWPAAQGAYCPIVFDAGNNPIRGPDNEATVWLTTNRVIDPPAYPSAYSGAPTGFGNTCATAWTGTLIDNANRYMLYASNQELGQTIPCDISTVFCTGLSAATTLTVRMVAYVEVAPRVGDKDFGVLAYSLQQSPPQDAVAMSTYQQITRTLPGGVPWTMNPKGEFWSGVVDLAKRVAPVAMAAAGAFLPGVGPLVSKAAQLFHLGGAIRNMVDEEVAAPPPRSRAVVRVARAARASSVASSRRSSAASSRRSVKIKPMTKSAKRRLRRAAK